MIREYPTNTYERELERELGIGSTATQTIIRDHLSLRKLYSRRAPHKLTDEQKDRRQNREKNREPAPFGVETENRVMDVSSVRPELESKRVTVTKSTGIKIKSRNEININDKIDNIKDKGIHSVSMRAKPQAKS
ncbi:hypothetical protein EVAR_50910_1 [Eumeta japonica]|uniref:Uncharacterized protein n=1 Tax=Eumeta variegata TaxID=151549 RepID=A0A4C1Y9J5_EUMVA|nr:hypothetical protein EVAR_50910_1 [Eumeta japonica]